MRRRTMALVASVGAGAAMLVASPAVPAGAAVLAETATASDHVRLTAHAPTGPAVGRLGNFLDITCDFTVSVPHVFGAGFLDSGVAGIATVECTYDAFGGAATVDRVAIYDRLDFNGARVDDKLVITPNTSFEFSDTSSRPCVHGHWTNRSYLHVTFPAGYEPRDVYSDYPDTSVSTDIIRCPGDPPDCIETCGGGGTGGGGGSGGVTVPSVLGTDETSAVNAINAAGLTPDRSYQDDCVSPGDVEMQNPSSGAVVPPGSTVTLTISTCSGGGGR